MSTFLATLLSTHAREGRVAWIGVREARRGRVIARERVRVTTAGMEGDHRTRPGKRAVTLVQAEHLPVIAALVGEAEVTWEALRRNVAVSGLNLLALRGATFRLGTAVLRGTGPCAPCSRMTEAFGPGGYNAVRGHGGITAEVVRPGEVALGDPVVPLDPDEPPGGAS